MSSALAPSLRHLASVLGAIAVALCVLPRASAQCAAFSPGFGPRGVNGGVAAAVEWDDGSGSGPALFVTGSFTSAGDELASNIAKWDGTRWTPLGQGLDSIGRALAVFDDGTGAKLYVGGDFRFAGGLLVDRIACWNGTSWSGVGGLGFNNAVTSLQVYDGGNGPELFAGGFFLVQVVTQLQLNGLARLSGGAWVPAGAGLPFGSQVRALAAHDDGTGAKLWIGGTLGASNLQTWNGSVFASPGFTTDSYVTTLVSHDDGGGPALFLGGQFTTAGGQPASHIARWRGGSIATLGAGLDQLPWALASFDDGTGSALYAGGNFQTAGSAAAPWIARWNGASWSAIGGGVDTSVQAFAVHDDGAGPALFAGGNLHVAGSVGAVGIARWRGGAWSNVGTSLGLDGFVDAIETFDDGSGSALYVGGPLKSAGGVLGTIFRWNGTAWTALRNEPGWRTLDFAVFDRGFGPELYAAERPVSGFEFRLLRWDGTTWSVEHHQTNASCSSLEPHTDGLGASLVLGGTFANVAGVPGTAAIARWDGTSFSAFGSGLPGAATSVFALRSFDDGSGPAMYASVNSPSSTGTFVDSHIARWNGTTWSVVGAGLNTAPRALETFDDGSGLSLWAGGTFTSSGATPLARVARWTGASWVAGPAGIATGGVNALAAYDDGSAHGLELYATGSFTLTGVPGLPNIARLRGGAWEPITLASPGIAQIGARLAVFDDQLGPGPALYVSGSFSAADGLPSMGLARYAPTGLPGCVGDPGVAFCFGDALDTQVTQVCPCANYGAPRHGCANSVNANGALLVATGSTAIDVGTGTDTVVLASSSMPATASLGSVFLQGDAEFAGGTVFGDGVRCVDGALVRLAYKPNLGGAAQFPEAGNLSLSQRGGVVPGSGVVRAYQTYYRSASAVFCPPATFNVTNGVRILW